MCWGCLKPKLDQILGEHCMRGWDWEICCSIMEGLGDWGMWLANEGFRLNHFWRGFFLTCNSRYLLNVTFLMFYEDRRDSERKARESEKPEKVGGVWLVSSFLPPVQSRSQRAAYCACVPPLWSNHPSGQRGAVTFLLTSEFYKNYTQNKEFIICVMCTVPSKSVA